MNLNLQISDKTGESLVIKEESESTYNVYLQSNDQDDYSLELQQLLDKAEFDGTKVTKEMVMEELDIELVFYKQDLLKRLRAIVTVLEMRCGG